MLSSGYGSSDLIPSLIQMAEYQYSATEFNMVGSQLCQRCDGGYVDSYVAGRKCTSSMLCLPYPRSSLDDLVFRSCQLYGGDGGQLPFSHATRTPCSAIGGTGSTAT